MYGAARGCLWTSLTVLFACVMGWLNMIRPGKAGPAPLHNAAPGRVPSPRPRAPERARDLQYVPMNCSRRPPRPSSYSTPADHPHLTQQCCYFLHGYTNEFFNYCKPGTKSTPLSKAERARAAAKGPVATPQGPEGEDMARMYRKYDIGEAKKAWTRLPVDGLGYTSSHEMLQWSDAKLKVCALTARGPLMQSLRCTHSGGMAVIEAAWQCVRG